MALTVAIFDFSTLSSHKLPIITRQVYDDHPCQFKMSVRRQPSADTLYLHEVSSKCKQESKQETLKIQIPKYCKRIDAMALSVFYKLKML